MGISVSRPVAVPFRATNVDVRTTKWSLVFALHDECVRASRPDITDRPGVGSDNEPRPVLWVFRDVRPEIGPKVTTKMGDTDALDTSRAQGYATTRIIPNGDEFYTWMDTTCVTTVATIYAVGGAFLFFVVRFSP